MKTWNEVMDQAKVKASKCRGCRICNGIACAGEIPGVGGKGNGNTFKRNVAMLQNVKVQIDTLVENTVIDTSSTLFNHRVSLPVYAAPISGISNNYGASMSEYEYSLAIIEGCKMANTIAFCGDGANISFFTEPLQAMVEKGGKNIPTIKPWNLENIKKRLDLLDNKKIVAVACDIDAAGLIFLRNSPTPVGSKSVEELAEMKKLCKVPFIVKGIMNKEGALKAIQGNVDAIVVSNHGGRILDDALSSIEVLSEIAEVAKGKVTILVDGGFRSGVDVFKALALGADGVLIGRPLSMAAIGEGAEGVNTYLAKIQLELQETMAMAGCNTIAEISADKVKFVQ